MSNLIKIASTKYEFEKMLIDLVESTDEALEGSLQDLNSTLVRYHNEPYDNPADVKYYNKEEYDGLVKQVKNRIDWMLSNINFAPNGIYVYRALSVKDEDNFVNNLLNDTINVGKYWSFDKIKAQPYWGKSELTSVVLYGELPLSSIDLLATIKANTILAFSKDENEITAIHNSEIFIISTNIKNKDILINKKHKI